MQTRFQRRDQINKRVEHIALYPSIPGHAIPVVPLANPPTWWRDVGLRIQDTPTTNFILYASRGSPSTAATLFLMSRLAGPSRRINILQGYSQLQDHLVPHEKQRGDHCFAMSSSPEDKLYRDRSLQQPQ